MQQPFCFDFHSYNDSYGNYDHQIADLQPYNQWMKANLIMQIMFQSGMFQYSSKKPIIRSSHTNHQMHIFENLHGYIK